MNERRRGLGRGLGALIPSGPEAERVDRPVDVFFRQGEPGPREEAAAESAEAGSTWNGPGDERSTWNTGSADGAPPSPPPTTHTGADVARSAEDDLVDVPGVRFAEVPLDQVRPNPRQPRQVFDDDELAELEHSVREIGVLQPVVLRPLTGEPDDGTGVRYELVMGERRWRASQRAGLATIPAIVRSTTDDDLLRDALLENLHRSQLNPLEEAAAYGQLLEDFGCTHDDLARRIGRSRPQISNTLRLLRLPPLVQRRVAAGVLSAGHARALLGLADAAAMERLAQRIVAEGLSVRSTEELVSLGDGSTAPARRRPRQSQRHEGADAVAGRLSDRLDTRVTIAVGATKGKMTVEFAGIEDLDRILGVLAPEEKGALEP